MLKKSIQMGILSLSLVAFINGCGSSVSTTSDYQDTTDDTTAIPSATTIVEKEGLFLDTGVDGLGYSYNGENRLTQEKDGLHGVFSYLDATPVKFSLGTLDLGEVVVPANRLVTPYTLAGVAAGTESNLVAIMASLLQSLDLDADLSNGITIAPEVVTALNAELGEDATLETLTEESIMALIETINNALELNLQFVPITEALAHLGETIDEIDAGLIVAPEEEVLDEEEDNATVVEEEEDTVESDVTVTPPVYIPTGTGTGTGTTGSTTRTS